MPGYHDFVFDKSARQFIGRFEGDAHGQGVLGQVGERLVGARAHLEDLVAGIRRRPVLLGRQPAQGRASDDV
jgi:hypothetical protein